jgi:microsomal dipeptidase-like Zn-dependent dipeptidase
VAGLAAAVAGSLALARPLGRRLVEHRVERRFSVLTGAPARPVSERARELHRTLLIADLHADSLLYGRDLLRRSRVGHVDVPRLIEGNVALQALAACVRVPSHLNAERNEDTSDDVALLSLALCWPPATWRSGLARAIHLAARARQFADRSEGRLTILASRGEVAAYLARRATAPGISAGLLTIEGAAALDGDLDNVDRLADAGYRIFGLTHMVDNAFAGSSSGVGKGGLTAAGRELVRRLETRRVLVDVAHASPAAVDGVLEMATRPVVASHTGLRAIRDVGRNLSDEHVRGIGATGGVVGIGFWPAVLDGDDASAIARSVAHAVSVAGVEHVALGSDFDGAVPTPFDAAGVAQLTEALLAEGLADADVRAVMGGNVFGLLERSLPD